MVGKLQVIIDEEWLNMKFFDWYILIFILGFIRQEIWVLLLPLGIYGLCMGE